VSFEGLGKRFGDAWALREVTLDVPERQVAVLLGASGSGKSTLLRLVDGLESPSEGRVVVQGTDVSAIRGRDLRTLRSKVGFIFQQFELVGPLTALENVLTGASARLRGPRLGAWSYPRSLRSEALDHLERVGLRAFAERRADTLSGGQQQRVAIARALMQHPAVLLADEPVASLDPESAVEVMALLRQVAACEALTVVCSLHHVELALSWGDRIVGLRSGSVVMDSPAADLTRDHVMGLYQRSPMDDDGPSPRADEVGVGSRVANRVPVAA